MNQYNTASRIRGYVPYDIDHEQDVLGFAISDEKARTKILLTLNENDLGDPIHKIIFSAIKNLVQKNDLVDEITVRKEVEKLTKPGKVSLPYIGSLVDNKTSVAGLDKKIEFIKNYSNRKKAWETSHRLIRAVESNADNETIIKLGASIGRNAYVDYGGDIYPNFYTYLSMLDRVEAVSNERTGFRATILFFLVGGLYSSGASYN